jgi:hypothetical protein
MKAQGEAVITAIGKILNSADTAGQRYFSDDEKADARQIVTSVKTGEPGLRELRTFLDFLAGGFQRGKSTDICFSVRSILVFWTSLLNFLSVLVYYGILAIESTSTQVFRADNRLSLYITMTYLVGQFSLIRSRIKRTTNCATARFYG